MVTRVPEYIEDISGNFEFNYKDELEYWLKELNIDKEEICLIGSIPLYVAGIRENHDIDFITTSETKKKIRSKIKEHPKCEIKSDGAFYFGDYIHSGPSGSERFDYLGLDNEDIIYDNKYHMIVDGYKIFRLELLLSKKSIETRPKDLEDLKKIEESGLIGGPGWNWDLVYSLPSWEKPKKSFSKLIRELIKDSDGITGLSKTLARIISNKVGIDKAMDNFFASYNRFLFNRKISKFQNHHHYIQMRIPIPLILSNYIVNEKFRGWDFILDYVLNAQELPEIEGLEEKEKIRRRAKMQENNHSPVTISKEGRVLNGRSTLVNKILEDEFMVEVEIQNKSKKAEADKRWLENIGLSKAQLDFLHKKRWEIFERSGLIFYALLWPPAHPRFEKIEEYIKQDIRIIDTKNYDISENTSAIISKLYAHDERAKDWRIEKKIQELKPEIASMKVLKLWLPDPKCRYHMDPEEVIFSKITRELKNECRKKFHKGIDNYMHDNMIHITESYKSNYNTYQVLNNLGEYQDYKI